MSERKISARNPTNIFPCAVLFQCVRIRLKSNQCQQLKEVGDLREIRIDKINYRKKSNGYLIQGISYWIEVLKMLLLSNVSSNLEVILSQPFTLETARFHSSYFTRVRKMTFQDIILFILRGFNTCTRTALNRFFMHRSEQVKTMSQQALSKARSHFDHSPFELIFRDLVQQRYCGEHEISLWHGYQFFAIDGSDVALPKMPALLKAFGGTGRNADSPTAKISLLYDVLNDFVVDAVIGRAGASERGFALTHMEKLRDICPDTKKLLIFDRGYPSAALISALKTQGLYFLMRVKSKWNRQIDESTRADSLVKLDETTTIRVIKFQLPSRETETLITNLFEVPVEEFPALYFKRWPIETKYDTVKNKLALENFTGYSKNVILQDFWATMYLTNLATVAKDEANAIAQKERAGKNNKYTYTPNLNQVIASLRDHLVEACFAKSEGERTRCVEIILTEIKKAVVPIRPNRSVRRPSNPRKAKYHHNRKIPS
jgi:hypothetical protein